MYVLTDNTVTGVFNRSELDKAIIELGLSKKVEVLNAQWTIAQDSILRWSESLITDEAILLLDYAIASNGETIDLPEFLQKLGKHTKVPVFSHVKSHLKYGVFGGVVCDAYTQGMQLAGLAERLLVFKQLPDSVITTQQTVAILQYNLIPKYLNSDTNIPTSITFINTPESLLTIAKRNVGLILTIAIIGAIILIFVIAILSFQVSSRNAIKKYMEFFRALFDEAPHPYILTDAAGKIELVNKSFEVFTGLTFKEVKGISSESLGFTYKGLPVDSGNGKSITRESVDNFEIDIADSKGQMHSLLCSTVVLKINEKKLVLTSARIIDNIKLAQKKIEESEYNFKSLFNHLPYVCVVTDQEGRFIMVNNAYCEAVGFTREEIIGKSLGDLGISVNVPELTTVNERLMTAGIVRDIEVETINNKGEKSVALYTSWLMDLNGQNYIVSALVDISRRKAVEEMLVQSNLRLNRISESSFEGISFILDEVIDDCNQQFAKLLELSVKELCGTQIRQVVPAEDYPEFFKYLHSSSAGSFESRLLTRRNTILDVECRCTTLETEKGNIFILVVRDITERKRQEIALKKSEEKYRALHESIVDGYALVNMSGNIVECNTVFSQMLGYAKEEIYQLTYTEITPSVWHAFESRMIETQVLIKGYSDVYEKEYRRKDGSIFPVELRIFGVRDNHDSVIAMWAIIRDITERKHAEEERRHNERRLQYAFSATSDAIWEWSIRTDNYYFSTRWYEILGYYPDELVMSREVWKERCHPDDFQELHRVFEQCKVVQGEYNFRLTYRMYAKNGNCLWILTRGKVVEYDNEGKALLVSGTHTDITERQLAEEIIRHNEERFRETIEQTGQMVYEVDLRHPTLMWMGAIESITGYTVDEFSMITLTTWQSMIHPEDQQIAMAGLEDAAADGDTFVVSYRIKTKLGGYIYVEDSGKLFKNPQGEIERLLGAIKNINDRKLAEIALRETTQKLSSLFESMNEPVVIGDLIYNELGEGIDYTIVDCNATFCQLTNLVKEEVLLCKASEVIPQNPGELLKVYTDVCRSGESKTFEYYSSEIERYFVISVHKIGARWFSSIATDVTELRQMMEVLSNKNKELESYLYVASHDMRSPLVNIDGFSKRVQKQIAKILSIADNSVLDQQAKESIELLVKQEIPKSLEFIFSNVVKLDSLVSGLLHISRTGRASMKITLVDMNKLFDEVLKILDFELEQACAVVVKHPLEACYGDADLLNRLFANLISNAIKYRSPDRQLHLEIQCLRKHKRNRYTITDNGIGIAERHLHRIWDVFFRVDNASAIRGEGIGLNVVKRIVEKHKGRVEVESEVNVGTTFTVELYNEIFTE